MVTHSQILYYYNSTTHYFPFNEKLQDKSTINYTFKFDLKTNLLGILIFQIFITTTNNLNTKINIMDLEF